MPYPKIPDFRGLAREIELYAQLKHEYGAKGVAALVAEAHKTMKAATTKLKNLPADAAMAKKEPSDLKSIRALRPKGPRRLWDTIPKGEFTDRLEGALLARMAGCTLGAPVEGWQIDQMHALAQANGDEFPPTDYWSSVPDPEMKRYGMSTRDSYTRGKLDGVPVDDDTVYTLLGLLIVEDFGPDFTTADLGQGWLKYLPYACTAEDVALRNLKKGVRADRAGAKDNPFCEWIGADIRSDPWGYMAPGWPERAAEMAYRDAYISHRRNGIYGEMYFSAAISAAFCVDDPVEALEMGLAEIPKQCATAKAVRWALKTAP